MSTDPRDDVLELSPDLWRLLERYHFDLGVFTQLREALRAGRAGCTHNRLRAPLEPPAPGDVIPLAPLGSSERKRLLQVGAQAIAAGQLAVVILAGGMATRFGGVVKASVEVLPGRSFLQLKLADIRRIAQTYGATLPVYLMTSFATDDSTRMLAQQETSAAVPVQTFSQFISLRLTEDGALFRDHAGNPSPYAPGHGDFAPALCRSGVLSALRAQGVKYIAMTNIDNLAATLEPALLGLHLEQAQPMSFEVVARGEHDQGGTPARVRGVFQIIEGLREPPGFSPASIPLFSTNCLLFDAQALDADFSLDWFAVAKKVGERTAIQFERLVNQLSAYLPCRGLLVERQGPDARFSPVKDPEELARARDTIVDLLRARGVDV